MLCRNEECFDLREMANSLNHKWPILYSIGYHSCCVLVKVSNHFASLTLVNQSRIQIDYLSRIFVDLFQYLQDQLNYRVVIRKYGISSMSNGSAYHGLFFVEI